MITEWIQGRIQGERRAVNLLFISVSECRILRTFGILISSVFPSLKRITQVYLHFGQNRGKSSSTVCGRICVLVLPPHLGQQSQRNFWFSSLRGTLLRLSANVPTAPAHSVIPFPPALPILHLCMPAPNGNGSHLHRTSVHYWQ